MEELKEALEGIDKSPKNESVEYGIDASAPICGHGPQELQLKKYMENENILDLSGKSLLCLPVTLSSKLGSLNISNNKFETLPSEIAQLINLTSLNACQNKLSDLPEWIGNLRYLVSLNFSSNILQSLPISFSKLNCLKELDLSRNKILRIPDAFRVGCISLQAINLSYNFIENWICPPVSVDTLQSISLAHNSLTSVPLWLYDGKASNLLSLDLHNNAVFNGDTETLNKTHKSILKELNVSNSNVTSKNIKFIGKYAQLTRLELSNKYLEGSKNKFENILREIDVAALQCCRNLIQLLLNNVGLIDLPEEIQELVSLEVLDCRKNSLLMLPEGLCKLTHLRVCMLSNNNLCLLPNKFGELTSLEELLLDENSLSCLPDSLKNLKSLTWLDLYTNLLSEVPSPLEDIIDNLKGLDLEYNYIPFFPDENSSESKELVPWLSKHKYELLVKNMRCHSVQIEGEDVTRPPTETIRVYGCRLPFVEREEFSSSDSCWSSDSLGNSIEILSEKNVNDPDEEASVDVNHDEEEERWDTVSESDEFDPNVFTPKPNLSLDRNESVVVIPQQVQRRSKFCPADGHLASVKEQSSNETYIPEEGQFDDA